MLLSSVVWSSLHNARLLAANICSLGLRKADSFTHKAAYFSHHQRATPPTQHILPQQKAFIICMVGKICDALNML